MSANVELIKENNTYLRVLCDEPWYHEELYNLFKKEVDGANNYSKFTHERFYNKMNGRLPIGLLSHLLKHSKSYNVKIDPALNNMRSYTREEIVEWMDSIDFPFTPYQYQYDIVVDAIRFRRLSVLADTGAGKSAVIYFITRFLLEESLALGREDQTLIMIPNITLRSQIISDFISYGWKDARSWCEEIIPSKSKYSNKRVVITTWQSIQRMDNEYFENFTSILVDEAHGASASVQTKILNKCLNANDRLGFTGTLNGTEHHKFKIESVLGISKTYVVTEQLKKLGQAAQTKIFMTKVGYNKTDLERISKLDYMAQVDYLHLHRGRMEYLCKIASSLAKSNENVLVIFEKVEKGVEHYQKYLQEIGLGDITRVVTGDVKIEERNHIKAELESKGGFIFLATWGTLSTGVNIKNLHSLIFVSSSKGRIRVLQTVGRMLRVHESKKWAKIFDFTDDTRLGLGSRFFSTFIDHAKERFKHYKDKKHPVNSNISVNLNDIGVSEEDYKELLKESNKRKAAKEFLKQT